MAEILVVEERMQPERPATASPLRMLLAVCCVLGPFIAMGLMTFFLGQLIAPSLYQSNPNRIVFNYSPAAPDDASAAKAPTAAKPGAAMVVADRKMFLPARHYAGRVSYAIASVFLALAALTTFFFSTAVVYRGWKWPGVIGAIVIWGIIAFGIAHFYADVHGRYLVVRDLLNAADHFTDLAAFITMSGNEPVPTGQALERLIFFNTTMALIPIGILLTALAIVTATPPAEPQEATLKSRLLVLRCLLLLASASFVMGVICNKALVEWPLQLVSIAQAVALRPIADSLVMQFGALGTAAIFAAFAPAIAVWMQDVQVMRSGDDRAGNGGKEEGLMFAPMTTVTAIVAMLAPVLASPVVDSLKSLVGALSK